MTEGVISKEQIRWAITRFVIFVVVVLATRMSSRKNNTYVG